MVSRAPVALGHQIINSSALPVYRATGVGGDSDGGALEWPGAYVNVCPRQPFC
ncbi:MAG: hypothetical protein LBH11_05020 [Propionibacteriaceae bacterium]|nr:hypothetical protein [Propionibacteriaceae bacterium]